MKRFFALTFIFCASLILAPIVSAGPEHVESKDKMVAAPAPCDPRWYFSLGGSVDFPIGEFSEGVEGADISGDADLDVLSRDWDDVYANWWNVQGEIGYVLTDRIELFGNFRYTHAEAKILTGDVLDFGNFDLEFVNQFGDYDAWGGELGVRYFFLDKQARIRPYVAISGGATFVNAIGLRAETEVFGTNIVAYDGPFYDDSVVGTAAAVLGVEFQVIPCKFSVGIDAGVRWQSELEDNDSGFEDFETSSPAAAATRGDGRGSSFQEALVEELSHLNDGGSHFTIPVTIYAKFRF
jgi:hypothetical protein